MTNQCLFMETSALSFIPRKDISARMHAVDNEYLEVFANTVAEIENDYGSYSFFQMEFILEERDKNLDKPIPDFFASTKRRMDMIPTDVLQVFIDYARDIENDYGTVSAHDIRSYMSS